MKKTRLKDSIPIIAAASGDKDPDVSFSIRPAQRSDLRILLKMIRELAAFERLEKEVTATVTTLAAALFGPGRAASALLAEARGKALGYAIYYSTFSSFLGRRGIFLDDVFVRPAYRGKGVGRALLEWTARIGEEMNCGRLEWIALRWNKEALRFYTNLGACKANEWVLLRMDRNGIAKLAANSKPPGSPPAAIRHGGIL